MGDLGKKIRHKFSYFLSIFSFNLGWYVEGMEAITPLCLFLFWEHKMKMDDYDLLNNLPENPRPLFFRRTDAKKLFGISPRQLENLAMERKGPPYYRCGKFTIYSVTDFVEWLTQHPIKTNSREGGQ